MSDYQPTLQDRIDDRERVNVQLSKTSYLSILFALEGLIVSEVRDLSVQSNYQEADKVLEVITELSNSMIEYAVHHTDYDGKKDTFQKRDKKTGELSHI